MAPLAGSVIVGVHTSSDLSGLLFSASSPTFAAVIELTLGSIAFVSAVLAARVALLRHGGAAQARGDHQIDGVRPGQGRQDTLAPLMAGGLGLPADSGEPRVPGASRLGVDQQLPAVVLGHDVQPRQPLPRLGVTDQRDRGLPVRVAVLTAPWLRVAGRHLAVVPIQRGQVLGGHGGIGLEVVDRGLVSRSRRRPSAAGETGGPSPADIVNPVRIGYPKAAMNAYAVIGFATTTRMTTPRIGRGFATMKPGLTSMPTETKKRTANASRNGSASAAA